MTAEIATIDGEVIEQRAPMTLFGTDDPTAVVERASTVATALASVINERRLYASIGGKKHVQVEGWTLLGSMLGVFAEIEWSRPLENGWEARAVARTLAGNVVGAAEAMCTASERRWKDADTYAVRSMAQTRAVSKALRMPLGFIMHLAGYDATPAEEIPTEQPEPARGPAKAAPSPRGSAPVQYRRAELAELMVKHDLDNDAVLVLADRIGIPSDERPMSDESMDRLIAAIETPPASSSDSQAATVQPPVSPPGGEAAPAPSMDDVLSAAGPGAEEIPPKPATDAYRALPPHEKANARAYWHRVESAEPVQESLLGEPVA